MSKRTTEKRTRKPNKKYSSEEWESAGELLATLDEENEKISSSANEKESSSANEKESSSANEKVSSSANEKESPMVLSLAKPEPTKRKRGTRKKKDTTLTVELDVEPIESSCGLPGKADGSTRKKKDKKSKSGRKNTDNNAFELVVALMPFYHDKTVSELTSLDHSEISRYVNVPAGEYANYMKDLETRTPNVVKNYMDTLHRKVQSEFPDETITGTDLEGKNLKTNELKDLNTGKDKKQAKADVYFRLEKGSNKRIIGLSVKQTKDCTKTNFSVEKMLYEITNDKQIRKDLSDLRKKVIIDNGLLGEARQLNAKRPDLTAKELETLKDGIRAKLNRLFSPKANPNNPYWIALKSAINERIQGLAEEIVKNLFPSDLGYPLYEFDGIDFVRLDISNDTKITMKPSTRYTMTQSGEDRDAAKLFYQLTVDNKKYRIEIRFKGNIWASSPQFLTHETNSPDSYSSTSSSGSTGSKTKKKRKTK